MYNTFRISDTEVFENYIKRFNIPENSINDPALFINEKFLIGESEIEQQFKKVFLAEKENTIKKISGEKFLQSYESEPQTIIYFYTVSCEECSNARKFLNSLGLADLFGDNHAVLIQYNISESGNSELIKKYFAEYAVPEKDQKVPIVFFGNRYLSGEKAIEQELIEVIKNNQGIKTPILDTVESINDGNKAVWSWYEFLGIMAAGFVNGLNPCSISLLLFFISMILAKNTNILRIGLSFSAGKFVAYFMIGTILFNLFAGLENKWFQSFQDVVKIILAAISAGIVVLNIQDFFAAKYEKYNKIKMQLPVKLRKINHQLIKKITSAERKRMFVIISFVLGAILSTGEFFCTGQIYLASIIYMIKRSPVFDIIAIIYFLLYGIMMITPMLILTIALYKGKEIFYVSEAVRKKMHIIKFLNALIFLVFLIIILVLF
jgi:glutaredoxin